MPAAVLGALADASREHLRPRHPSFATRIGDRCFDDPLVALSVAAREGRGALLRDTLDRVNAVGPSGHGPADQVTRQILLSRLAHGPS